MGSGKLVFCVGCGIIVAHLPMVFHGYANATNLGANHGRGSLLIRTARVETVLRPHIPVAGCFRLSEVARVPCLRRHMPRRMNTVSSFP
jgi:hypothetical protein